MFYSTVSLQALAGLLSITSLAASSPLPLEKRTGPKCQEMVIPVSITASNAIIPKAFGLISLQSLLATGDGLAFSALVQGTYNIAGRYCEPEVDIPARRKTLQILSHPATYDRNYWSGGGYPGQGYDGDKYSWVDYASKQGYPTFALDRLGNGNSSHPDATTVVQMPAQAATVHEIIKLARSSPAATRSPFPRAFSKIVHVGCSMGSLMANYLNVYYPIDIDATILTGFSKQWANAIPGFTATALLLPAAATQPTKYGTLDVGYLAANSESGANYLLFYGPAGTNYDAAFLHQDYLNRGTVTTGEAVSSSLIPVAGQYLGAVLLMTGQQDVLFCGTLALEAVGPGNCGYGSSSILAQTQSLYPKASSYTWHAVPNSGHCWEHQFGAKAGFGFAHDWLSSQGY